MERKKKTVEPPKNKQNYFISRDFRKRTQMETKKRNLNFTVGSVDQVANKMELEKVTKTGVKKILTDLKTLVLRTIVILEI